MPEVQPMPLPPVETSPTAEIAVQRINALGPAPRVAAVAVSPGGTSVVVTLVRR